MQLVFLCLAAAVGGAMNSIAGGGTLLTFPSLVAALGGTPAAAVLANGTSAVALLPGSLAGAWGFREDLRSTHRWWLWLLLPSAVGGLIGSVLASALDPKYFNNLVPWLILGAAVLFALQRQIARLIGIGQPHEVPGRQRFAAILAFQFLVAIYGGYFGAGIGILMLSALALMGLSDIHQMNSLKNLFAGTINGVAAVQFIAMDKVVWRLAIPMLFAGLIGGYLGARVSKAMNKDLVRAVVTFIGFALAAVFFYRQWAG